MCLRRRLISGVLVAAVMGIVMIQSVVQPNVVAAAPADGPAAEAVTSATWMYWVPTAPAPSFAPAITGFASRLATYFLASSEMAGAVPDLLAVSGAFDH